MPELPEVETIVNGLKRKVIGKKIIKADILRSRPLQNISERKFKNFIKDEIISSVERFGKYLLFKFKSGKSIISHLRMTGKYIYHPDDRLEEEMKRHVRVIFYFSDKTLLLFHDLRVFGTIKVYNRGETIEEFSKVGIDPFAANLSAEYLLGEALKRKLSIKQFLLDQKVIAGLGNIYVCEALFRTKINPGTRANQLTEKQARLLVKEIRAILKLAIKNNGTSISDFRNVDDKKGNFQKMLQVYGKTGCLCTRCKQNEIKRIKQGQRSTFFCPVCQR